MDETDHQVFRDAMVGTTFIKKVRRISVARHFSLEFRYNRFPADVRQVLGMDVIAEMFPYQLFRFVPKDRYRFVKK